jgi:hypothetical protein
MKVGGWNKWLTFIANTGVFLGLILVAYEIKQSQKQLEISALADGTDNFTEAMIALTQDEGLAKLVYRAENNFEDLSEFELWRSQKYLDRYVSMSEQDYLVLTKLPDLYISAGFRHDWRENMQMPLYKSYWANSKERFSPEFRNFIDDILQNQ